MHRRALAHLGAVVLVSAIAAPASATIVEALSLDELTARSTHVVVVTCTDRRSVHDGARRIVTEHALRVDDVVRGSARLGDTLTMLSLGGEVGDLGMRVEGEPHLTVGARYLVFLRTLSDGATLRPVGMSQGVMPIQERGGVLTVTPGGAGLALRHRVQGGRLVPAPPALLHPEPLDAIRARVEAVAP